MGLFLSTTVNRIDSKGRVSVPGPFRAALNGHTAVILMKSPIYEALEGFAPSTMDDIAARLNEYPMFSTDQDDLAAATMAEAMPLNFDSEGRIVLPSELLKYAGIKSSVAFVGLGTKFQVWEPAAWGRRRDAAQASVRAKGLTLPKAGHGSEGAT